jgi:integrase
VKDRFKMFCRSGGMYYVRDMTNLRKESLGTKCRDIAKRLVAAKNQATEQPSLNKGMAKVYLSASSPDFIKRTWADVMEKYVASGVESTRDRKERAFKSRPFIFLRKVKLVDTEATHLFAVLEHKNAGNSAHHYLRRLHNFALHLGWLLSPVMADAAWPAIRRRKFVAITEEDHQKIIAREASEERKLYYEMLWETGGSQSDVANLDWSRIDLQEKSIRFCRQKLSGLADGGETYLRIGTRLEKLLSQLPKTGFLFPTLRSQEAKDRAGYFRKVCLSCKIKGKTLHSYRYAWAQRAKTAGMPERDAMNHLGHKSRAIHAAYGRDARITILPLEFYEAEKKQKIIRFDQQTEAAHAPMVEVGGLAQNG